MFGQTQGRVGVVGTKEGVSLTHEFQKTAAGGRMVHENDPKPDHRAEATVTISGRTLHCDASGIDMYAAIDLLADKLDRLLMKHKGKLVDHHRGESVARSGQFG